MIFCAHVCLLILQPSPSPPSYIRISQATTEESYQGSGESGGTSSGTEEDNESDFGLGDAHSGQGSEESEDDTRGGSEEDSADPPDPRDVRRGLASAQLRAYHRALEDSWQGAFADARSALEEDHTVLVRGSVSELHDKLRRPLHDGHTMTVGDYCVTQLHIREVCYAFLHCMVCITCPDSVRLYVLGTKSPLAPPFMFVVQAKKLSYSALSSMLKVNKVVLAEQPNNLPASYDEIKRLLGVPDPVAFMEHSCACGKFLFPKCRSRYEWHERRNETCRLCGGKRFAKSRNNRGDLVLEPVCPFYYFGLQMVLDT